MKDVCISFLINILARIAELVVLATIVVGRSSRLKEQ